MVISLLYRTTRALLSVPAILLRGNAGKDAEVARSPASERGVAATC